MLIIIEGADKNGKTTLAKEIARQFGYRYVHHGAPQDGRDGYLKELKEIKNPVVMDRSFIGEMVYGPLLRGRSVLSDDDFVALLRLSGRYHPLVVWAHQTRKVGRHWEKQEKDVSADLNKQARQKFIEVVGDRVHGYMPVYTYSESTEHGMKTFISQLGQAIVARRHQAEMYQERISPKGYGCIAPSMILVGERNNPKATWAGLPFDNGVSSRYLNKALEMADINRGIYMINADDLDNMMTYGEILDILQMCPGTKVVALGGHADKYLKEFDLPHFTLEHPSYRNRFKHDKIEEYADQLKEIYRGTLSTHG